MAGPTSVGKSALALELADRLGAEIVGADAFQIYRGMSILTAQPSLEDLARVPHHLVGDISPEISFDAYLYAEQAKTVLAEIEARGHRALVVGGTGLYFRALIDGFAEMPKISDSLRAELSDMDLPDLLIRLEKADPAAAAQVDRQNKRRVTRALEIVETSGRPLSEFRTTPRHDVPGVLLVREREELRERIATSVRRMFDLGVLEEVLVLGESIGPTAARAIGLREIQALLRGEITREQCEEEMIASTRQYAKRQLTWFRNQTRFQTLDLTGTQLTPQAVDHALSVLDPK